MARFVYLGPLGERVERNFHQMTGEWVTGEPRDIDDAAAVEWLRRHHHWAEIVPDGEMPQPVAPRRGRPRKAG